VARQIFYDRLVEDYSRHPRTIILSSHLIDEVANLLEHVILIDKGRIILDDDAESIRGSAVTVTGETTKVTASQRAGGSCTGKGLGHSPRSPLRPGSAVKTAPWPRIWGSSYPR
jgi:ABC-type multidrug transport system ATPase subunit